MPQPQFVTHGAPSRVWCNFGNNTVPVIGGTMANIDLNDITSWTLQTVDLPGDNRQISHAQQAWRSRAVYLGDDYGPKRIILRMRYSEAVNSLAVAKAQLMQAGDQYLSFDNLTQIPAKLSKFTPVMKTKYAPYLWDVTLEFMCRIPYWSDIAATAIGSQALGGAVSPGTATTFNVTYNGSVDSDVVWTFTVPGGNGVPIVSFKLNNTTSAEALTVTFPSNLAASTAYAFTLDASKYTVVDGAGTGYDFTGSFPRLYGPVGTVNAMSATVVTASGTSTGLTVSGSVTPRWDW